MKAYKTIIKNLAHGKRIVWLEQRLTSGVRGQYLGLLEDRDGNVLCGFTRKEYWREENIAGQALIPEAEIDAATEELHPQLRLGHR